MLTLQLLEEFVLSKDKQAILAKLIPGSLEHDTFTALSALHRKGLDLSPEQRTILDRLNLSQPSFKLRQALLTLEAEGSATQEKREEAAKYLSSLFGIEFNYERPQKLAAEGQMAEDTVKYDSKLNPADIDRQTLITQGLKKAIICDSELINPALLDEKFIPNYLMKANQKTVVRTDFLPTLLAYMKKNKTKNYGNMPTNELMNLMTYDQLESINAEFPDIKNNHSFAFAVFAKAFSKQLETDKLRPKSPEATLARIAELKQMRKWLGEKLPSLQHIRDDMLLQILHLGIKVNKFDSDLYFQFLENCARQTGYFNESQNKRLETVHRGKQAASSNNRIAFVEWKSQQDLHEDYLQAHFQLNDSFSPFDKYFEPKFLTKKLMRSKLLRGLVVEGITEMFSQDEIRQIKEQKKLTLASGNREYFNPGDEITLQVEAKNVNLLQVMVYELDMLNYFKKNMVDLDQQIRLDGLIPGDIQHFSYEEPPVQLVTRSFTFDKLKGRRGVFIIEFVGSGLMSRAILRLGKLLVKEKMTVVGHVFQIFNEAMEPCKDPSTGIYLENTFLPVNEHGQVIIPFRKNPLRCKGIAFHNGVSSLINISINKQSYSLECVYTENKESMVLSGRGKLLAMPKLMLNGCQCTFAIIESAKADITVTDFPSVTSNSTIDKLPLSRFGELMIEFDVGPKIMRVLVKIDVVIKTMTGEKLNLSNQTTINFNSHQGTLDFANQYLRKNASGYFIEVLGKNGQPKRGLITNLKIMITGYHNVVEKTLQTDANGRIQLGQLPDVRHIVSNFNGQGDINIAQLNQSILPLSRLSHQSYFQLLQGERVQLPRLADQNGFLLFSKFNLSTISNLSSKIKFQSGKVVVPDLEPGNYQLLYPDSTVINFQVLAGKRLNETSIVSDDFLISPANKSPVFNILQQKIEVNQGKTVFKARAIGTNLQYSRCHLFLTNFYNQSYLNSLVSRKEQIQNRSKNSLLTKGNSYFSNKFVGDQLKYAMQRKNKTVYIGNTLQKPPLLLKRQFVENTTTEQENVTGQTGFQQKPALDQCFAAPPQQAMRAYNQSAMLRGASGININAVSKLQDFLGLPGLTIANVRPDKDGKFQVTIPSGYSCLTAVFISQNQVLAREVGLPDGRLITRDLRHKPNLQAGKYYSLKRTTAKLTKGLKYECKDVTATELKILDSFGKLYGTVKSLLSSKGMSTDKWQQWSFLTQWQNMPVQQKNDKYNEHCCNQFNLFIYFNDPEFFEELIKPFLSNKLNKKFIDYVLLQDAENIMKHLAPCLYSRLSNLQKVLLVRYLMNNGKPELASDVVAQIEMRAKLVKVDKKQYKVLFDTVLNVSAPQEQKDIAYPDSPTAFGAAPRMMASRARMSNIANISQQAMPMSSMNYSAQMMMDCMPAMQCQQAYDYGGGMQCFGEAQMNNARYTAMRQNSTLMQGYSELAQTKMFRQKEWGIQHYQSSSFSLLFYLDLAKWLQEHKSTQNFLTSNFIHFQSLRDAFCVLIFSDISSKPASLKPESKDKGIEIAMEGNAIVFQKQLCEATRKDEAVTIFQKFFDNSARLYQDEQGQWVQHKIEEYLVNKIYGCQVIVTNNTVNPCELDVLGQIPSGSIPVNTTDYTKSVNMVVPSYTTQFFQYNFYFPAPGKFGIYPANAAKDGVILAAAHSQEFQVKLERTKTELKTISDILEKGTKADILDFVATRNILNNQVFNFYDILYLLKDKDFYLKLINVLRKRKVYDYPVWSFGFYHLDLPSISEYLLSQKETLQNQLVYFKNSLITVSSFQMMEFYPLVNQRAHSLKERLNILNTQLRETYRKLLTYLMIKPEEAHSADDRLQLAYYLTIQDRIKEAIDVLGQIKEGEKSSLQYDYFRAYFDFYLDYPNFKAARALTEKYLSYPIISWRNLFYDVANQLAQFDGESPIHKKKDQAPKAKEQLQFLEASLSGSTIRVSHRNVEEVKVNFYLVDLELIFTRNPLITEGSDDFSFVKSAYEQVLKVDRRDNIASSQLKIPEKLASQNSYILISSKSKRVALTYFATSLKVLLDEEQGQLKVVDKDDKPLTKTYVKVIGQQHSGRFVFFKDGYTDLRGRFDYVTKSRGTLNNLKKFALFVLSEEHGSVIKQAGKPSGLDQIETKVQLVGSAWDSKAQTKMQQIQKVYHMNKAHAKRK